MLVMKFGGTSLADAVAMRRVADIVETARPRRPVVVVSAVAGVTNRLLDSARRAHTREATAKSLMTPLRDIHRRILGDLRLKRGLVDDDLDLLGEALQGVYLLRELTPRSLDYVASFGEVMSSKIFAALLDRKGVGARAWNAWDAGMVTDDRHGEANVLPRTYTDLKANLAPVLADEVPVVTGFVARAESGERTTLGRGGSDYTAAIIGRALGVEEIQIWTDVTGIMSCDPRIVRKAYTLRQLSFAEAAELAFFGAKVLHPKTVEPALQVGIPVRILNTFEPEDSGTLVVRETPTRSSDDVIQGLAVKRGNLLVSLVSTRMLEAEGYLAEVFQVLARHRISVDGLATSEVSVSMTVDGRYADALKGALKDLRRYARTSVFRNRAIICVVGEGMRLHHGIAGEVFGILGDSNINIELITQGASELNLSFVVKDSVAERTLRALHARFLENKPKARGDSTPRAARR